ncbi:hypothetical protein O6H91_20G028500 [Diphasiastrum complanatum]|uniref:Uncharacterized protein n=1 Tax=Diphasiastrum complanatum TaxID=34168 RepID=A0ACC2ANR8_DIPCM|nr:hypothetical protein O6H91_20G028500 [Diphasiastrum complanatum]
MLVPLMKLCAGRSVTGVKWLSTFIALSGMGVLEEEGSGWKGIIIPQRGNPWVFASSLISALQIFRSEVFGIAKALDAKRLNAIQSAVLSVLSFFWEICNLCTSSSDWGLDFTTLAQHLPWLPLIYNGIVCGGICSWLEIRALRGVNASVATLIYMTIPVWGAFFSTLLRHKSPSELELVGAPMILLATMWTNKMTSEQLTNSSQPYQNDQGLTRQNRDQSSHLNRRQEFSRPDEGYLMEIVLASTLLSADHLPGVMLISQLKSPFYTAQTERLVKDVDVIFQENTDCLSDFTTIFKPPQCAEVHNTAVNVGSPCFLCTEEHVCDIGA